MSAPRLATWVTAVVALGVAACDSSAPNDHRVHIDMQDNMVRHDGEVNLQTPLGRSFKVDLNHHGLPNSNETQDNHWIKLGDDSELVVINSRGTKTTHSGPLVARFYFLGRLLVVLEGDEKNPVTHSVYHEPVSWKSQKP